MSQKLSRDDLIELANKIRDPQNDDDDIERWMDLFQQNVPHPEASDLIFWSQNHGLGSNPTTEEIVDKALSYKAIQL